VLFAAKARQIIAAICALVRLFWGRIIPSEPVRRPLLTAAVRAGVDQLSGMSEKSSTLAALTPAEKTVAARTAPPRREIINFFILNFPFARIFILSHYIIFFCSCTVLFYNVKQIFTIFRKQFPKNVFLAKYCKKMFTFSDK
jgi:hypothetical protein